MSRMRQSTSLFNNTFKRDDDDDNESVSSDFAGADGPTSPTTGNGNEQVTLAWALTDARKSGFLRKESLHIKAWRSRFFVLKGHFLYAWSDNKKKHKKSRLTVDLTEATLARKAPEKETDSRKFVFKISDLKSTLYLQAESQADMDSWIDALNNNSNTTATKGEDFSKKVPVVPAVSQSACQDEQALEDDDKEEEEEAEEAEEAEEEEEEDGSAIVDNEAGFAFDVDDSRSRKNYFAQTEEDLKMDRTVKRRVSVVDNNSNRTTNASGETHSLTPQAQSQKRKSGLFLSRPEAFMSNADGMSESFMRVGPPKSIKEAFFKLNLFALNEEQVSMCLDYLEQELDIARNEDPDALAEIHRELYSEKGVEKILKVAIEHAADSPQLCAKAMSLFATFLKEEYSQSLDSRKVKQTGGFLHKLLHDTRFQIAQEKQQQQQREIVERYESRIAEIEKDWSTKHDAAVAQYEERLAQLAAQSKQREDELLETKTNLETEVMHYALLSYKLANPPPPPPPPMPTQKREGQQQLTKRSSFFFGRSKSVAKQAMPSASSSSSSSSSSPSILGLSASAAETMRARRKSLYEDKSAAAAVAEALSVNELLEMAMEEGMDKIRNMGLNNWIRKKVALQKQQQRQQQRLRGGGDGNEDDDENGEDDDDEVNLEFSIQVMDLEKLKRRT